MLDQLLELVGPAQALELRSDGHPGYGRAVRRHPRCRRIRHAAFANPPRGPKGSARSTAAVVRDRAMFPVDLLHKILRHTLAHHRRETIAFPRRLNAAMERLTLTAVWRNFVKKRSERRRGATTPAVRLGLADDRWSWKRVFSRRLFFDRTPLADPWPRLYRRGWTTPLLPGNARHELDRAF